MSFVKHSYCLLITFSISFLQMYAVSVSQSSEADCSAIFEQLSTGGLQLPSFTNPEELFQGESGAQYSSYIELATRFSTECSGSTPTDFLQGQFNIDSILDFNNLGETDILEGKNYGGEYSGDNLDKAPIFMYVSNQSPSPNEEVSISLAPRHFDLRDIERVEWFLDDEWFPEYANNTVITFTAGNLGEVTNVKAVIKASILDPEVYPNNSFIVGLDVNPTIFDVLWEAETSIPAGYIGGPIPGILAPIRLFAFIRYSSEDGTIYTEKDFHFKWDRGGISLNSGRYNGFGKSTIVVDGVSPIEAPLIIDITVTQIGGFLELKKQVEIRPIFPFLKVYKTNQISGIDLDNPIRNDALFYNNIESLVAFPFGFSKEDSDRGFLKYNWSIDKKPVRGVVSNGVDINSDNLDIRNANISIEVRNTKNPSLEYLQKANYDFEARF